MSGPDHATATSAALAEQAARQLVVDSALIAFAALALALPVYALLRSAGVRTLNFGRVRTDRLGWPDLAVACTMVALLVAMMAGNAAPPTDQDGQPGQAPSAPPQEAVIGWHQPALAALSADTIPPGSDPAPDPVTHESPATADVHDPLQGESTEPGSAGDTRSPSGLGIWFSAVFWGTVSLAVILYLGRIRGLPVISWMGLSNLHPGRTIGVALLALLVTLPIVFAAAAGFNRFVLEPYWPDLGAQEAVKLFMTSSDLGLRIALIISAVIVAPLAEELLFRGFLYPAIKRFTDPVFAMLCTALLFAAVHNNLPALVPLFILGIAFAIVYEYSGSLWTPIWMHALFNLTSIVLMLLGSGAPPPEPLPGDFAITTPAVAP